MNENLINPKTSARLLPNRSRANFFTAARRSFVGLVLASMLITVSNNELASELNCTEKSWPLWDNFKTYFVQNDGRIVVENIEPFRSFSEGQSYAMFFALVANDQSTFEKIWHWSLENLAGGNISKTLPSWVWGKADNGAWTTLDKNSASDADLWFAYDLLEAGRLWNRPDYTRDGQLLLANIERSEIATLPKFGKMLLPGPFGFSSPNNLWRLNPSYMPIPVLRRLAAENPQGPWTEIAQNTYRMISETSTKGFAADWVQYQSGFIPDSEKSDRGSYDSIRVYLWAGITSPNDHLAAPILRKLGGMAKATAAMGAPPEIVNTATGQTSLNPGPLSFSASLLPYFAANKQTDLLNKQLIRVKTMQADSFLPQPVAVQSLPYYDYVLSLFGLGWIEGRYRLASNGNIYLPSERLCARATP